MTSPQAPLVLDIGSALVRAGFAGDMHPRLVIPSLIGQAKNPEAFSSPSCYVGHEAEAKQGVLLMRRPLKDGVVQNWDDYELLVEHVMTTLKIGGEAERKVMFSAPVMNPMKNEQGICELMMERFEVRELCAEYAPVMSLFGSGRTSGLVLDVGESFTQIMPVWQGAMIGECVHRTKIAGEMLTHYLARLLTERTKGLVDPSSSQRLDIRSLKERSCFVSLDFDSDISSFTDGSSTRFLQCSLIDGTLLTLGDERIKVTESLFKPSLLGLETPSLSALSHSAIVHSPLDLRPELWSNIVLSGGSSLFPGFADRLQTEIRTLCRPTTDFPCHYSLGQSARVVSFADRHLQTFIGGSMLASLPNFPLKCISKQQYDEFGSSVIHRHCLKPLWG